MSDIIRLLPDSVANQIAAGEVINRPAAAIKELVENAVDAGATDIHIIIKDAGKTMIQVIDNGSGMSETDARMAFERHATSKIRKADDLFSLHTMGFRGEALPSICAISEVDIKTRTVDQQMGTHLVIAGSKVEIQEPCVCDKGTVITVRKLFFNVPARRKFLRSDNVELSNIIREFERMALVNNHLRLRIDAGSRNIDLRAGTFKQRIVDLWKAGLDNQLLPVEVDTSLVKIEGFISRPEFARRRNALQFMIANGRNMRHDYFRKAILNCYDNLIAADTQPCFFLKFTVDPQTIDVNRSPTKDDIKFEYESQIWPILTAAIKASLGKFSAVPSIDFTSDALPVIPAREGETIDRPEIPIPHNYNPFKETVNSEDSANLRNWEKLYEDFSSDHRSSQNPDMRMRGETRFSDTLNSEIETQGKGTAASGAINLNLKETIAPICLQYANRYIITTSRTGLLIVDQHRAHVKILYEEYMRRISKMEVVSQSVMFPETIELDETQMAAFNDVEDDLRNLGFNLEYEDGTTWKITSIPAMLKSADSKDLIFKILDSVSEDSLNFGKERVSKDAIVSRSALLMAKSSAISRGHKLSQEEMEHLIGELFMLPDPALTPTGNPIFCKLDEERVDRLFNQ